MNQRVLLGFGDSWAAGFGLDDVSNDAYLSVLAKQLEVPCENYAVPSTGIPHLITQLKRFLNSSSYSSETHYTAIFFLSAVERDIMFDDRGVEKEMQPRGQTFEHYYKTIYSDDLAIFRLNTNLLALRQLCTHYNINDYYLFGWQTPKLWAEIDLSKIWQQGEKSLLDLFLLPDTMPNNRNVIFLKDSNNPYMIPAQAGNAKSGHPNQLGHKMIAQTLYNWITIV